ncbi:MAG: hypothetical protein P4M11_14350 [Candidatus Pacebacteria bacterium]|nr:hypothetical protein [Candidatus Paceibacterota bacterium]
MIPLELAEPALDAYNKLKMKRAYKWLIYKIEDDKRIALESSGDSKATYAMFVEKMPKLEPRYVPQSHS